MMEGRCKAVPELAVLAGEGLLPVAIAKSLFLKGTPPAVLCLGEKNPLLESFAERVVSVPEISVRSVVGQLKGMGSRRLVLAGAVPKRWMYGGGPVDRETLEWIASLPARDDHALLGSIVELLEGQGLEVVSYRSLIPENLAPEGFIAGREPSGEEWTDIRCGIGIAREVVRLSFGQALAVKGGSVLAVEAMEGTDEMIRRAGRIASGGVVVKMMRFDQDERFDLPTVGPQTLDCMADAGFACLAVEARRTVILDRERFAELALEYGIAVTGFSA
jgi:DUF1009 family protein